MWKCCYQSLCGCYSFGSDSPIPTMHHAPWRVILLLEAKLLKLSTFTFLSLSSPQRSSFPSYCPCFQPLHWWRDGQGVQGEGAAVWGGVEEEQRTWWRSRARTGSRGPLPGARERKSIVAAHSYSFHFNFPDKIEEKNGSRRTPYFNTKNVFHLRYPTSFTIRIPSFCQTHLVLVPVRALNTWFERHPTNAKYLCTLHKLPQGGDGLAWVMNPSARQKPNGSALHSHSCRSWKTLAEVCVLEAITFFSHFLTPAIYTTLVPSQLHPPS